MVAEPPRDQIPEWDGKAPSLERLEEDVLIFYTLCAEGAQKYHWSEAVGAVEGLSREGDRFGTPGVNVLQLEDRAHRL